MVLWILPVPNNLSRPTKQAPHTVRSLSICTCKSVNSSICSSEISDCFLFLSVCDFVSAELYLLRLDVCRSLLIACKLE